MFSSSSEIWSFFLSPYLNILYVKKKKKDTPKLPWSDENSNCYSETFKSWLVCIFLWFLLNEKKNPPYLLKKFLKTRQAKYWIPFRIGSAPNLLNHLNASTGSQTTPLIVLCGRTRNFKMQHRSENVCILIEEFATALQSQNHKH